MPEPLQPGSPAKPDPAVRRADVVVAGAGPAGCTLAYLLAARGGRVVVVDRAPGPTFKVGESLLPEGVRLCERMGLGERLEAGPFLPKLAARFVLSGSGEERRFTFADALRPDRGSRAYQVKRRDFDDLLHRHARDAGARFLWDRRVADVDLDGDVESVAVELTDGARLRASFFADATGQPGFLARKLGLKQPIPSLKKVALFSHFEGIPRAAGAEAGDIIAIWSTEYWVWVIPFTDGTTSVGVVGDADTLRAAGADDAERFDVLCSATEPHRRILSGRRALQPLERRADFSYECRTLAGERFVLVGDAGGFIDPIFSSGVYLAQQAAFLAAGPLGDALADARPLSHAEQAHYTDTMHLASSRFLKLIVSSYEHGFIEKAVSGRARPGLRKAFTSLLAGDVFHEANPLVSMGILRSERMI